MLTVVMFLWSDQNPAKAYTYNDTYVLTLKKQLDKYLTIPHEVVCVTDQYTNNMQKAGIRYVELNRTTFRHKTRYVKLSLFSTEAAETIGKRIFYIDLDSVIVGNIDSIVNRDEDLVLFKNPNYGLPKRAQFNTSFILHTPGTFTKPYDDFKEIINSAEYKDWPYGATDQKLISYLCKDHPYYWTDADGLFGAGRIGNYTSETACALPTNAKIVTFPGNRTNLTELNHSRFPWLKQCIL